MFIMVGQGVYYRKEHLVYFHAQWIVQRPMQQTTKSVNLSIIYLLIENTYQVY